MVFYIMAGVAGLTTVLMLIFGVEPRNMSSKGGAGAEPERSCIGKLHVLKQVFGGVVVSALLCNSAQYQDIITLLWLMDRSILLD